MIDAEILGRAEVGGEDKTIISKVDIAKNANGHYGNSGKEYTIVGELTTFKGEEKGLKAGMERIKYFSEKERIEFEIFIDDDGRLRNWKGEIFSTVALKTISGGKGNAIFVMTTDGRIFIGPQSHGYIHHSSFVSGGAVAAAGEIVVRAGRVSMINAKSGHYFPEPWELSNKQFLDELSLRGVDTNSIDQFKGF